jgi:hypothetical protein
MSLVCHFDVVARVPVSLVVSTVKRSSVRRFCSLSV